MAATTWNEGRWESWQNMICHLGLVSVVLNSSGISGDLTECHASATHLEVGLTLRTSDQKSWSFWFAFCALAEPTHWLTFGGKNIGKSNWMLKENKHGNALYVLLKTSTHLHSQRCLRRLFWVERSFRVNANKPGLWLRLWQGRKLAHSLLWDVYHISKPTVSLLRTESSVKWGSSVGVTQQDKAWLPVLRTSQSIWEAVAKNIKEG